MSRQENANIEPLIKVLTPEGIEFVLSPAGLPVRTISYAIDIMIQWVIIIIMFIVFESFGFGVRSWFFLIMNFIINWFYHVIFELAFKGQSIGKRIMGIRVVKNDGSPIDPASSFIRNLLRFADTFNSIFYIAFISIAVSSGFRRLGDWAGGTLVVYSSMAKAAPHSFQNRFLEKYDIVNPNRLLSSDEKQAILNFARRYHLLGEARANEIADIYAPCIKDDDSDESGLSNAAFLIGIARKLSGET